MYSVAERAYYANDCFVYIHVSKLSGSAYLCTFIQEQGHCANHTSTFIIAS